MFMMNTVTEQTVTRDQLAQEGVTVTPENARLDLDVSILGFAAAFPPGHFVNIFVTSSTAALQ